jgi:hypothetical protein
MNRRKNRSNRDPKIATFRGRSIDVRTWIFVILPGSFLTIIFYLYGFFLAGNTYQQHGPALAYLRARSWIVIGTILLIGISTYFLYRLLISLQWIEIYKNGIRLRTSFFRQRTFHWSELSGITSSATKLTMFGKDLRTIPGGRIIPKSGSPIQLTNRFQDTPKLIKIVKSNIYPLVWPALKTTFRNGEMHQFGQISLCRDYLQISDDKIPWNAINRICVDSGFLVVELRGDSNKRVSILNISNLELLLKVIDWGCQT